MLTDLAAAAGLGGAGAVDQRLGGQAVVNPHARSPSPVGQRHNAGIVSSGCRIRLRRIALSISRIAAHKCVAGDRFRATPCGALLLGHCDCGSQMRS